MKVTATVRVDRTLSGILLPLNTIYRFVSKSNLIEAKRSPKANFNFHAVW